MSRLNLKNPVKKFYINNTIKLAGDYLKLKQSRNWCIVHAVQIIKVPTINVTKKNQLEKSYEQ